MSKEDLRKALIADFNTLLVKEFTVDWQSQRVMRRLEIEVMELDNLDKIITKALREQLEEIEGRADLYCSNLDDHWYIPLDVINLMKEKL